MEEEIVYGEYTRKSSISEDKQVQSIDTQQRELGELATSKKLNVKLFITETRSAFEVGRPEFEKLIKSIEKSEINGLLVVHVNRIARNPVDAGRIINLIDNGYLKEVRTLTNTYRNTSTDKMMLAFEMIVSKKDSDDKSEGVKKGLKTRATKGYPNGVAVLGYLNDPSGEKGNKKWLVDDLRFPLVKKVFKLFLSGRYSVRQLHKIARDELCLRTQERKVEGGKPIALSYVYVLLSNPIYAGFFHYPEDVRHELNKSLPRMITEEEFWEIQTMLGKNGRPKPKKHDALYNHFMKCNECGGGVTPDFKFQLICSNCKHKFSYQNKESCPKCNTLITAMDDPVFLSYVYYYCINRKKNKTCTKGGVLEANLEKDLIADLDERVTISDELSKWCIKHVQQLEDKELDDAIERAQIKARELREVEKRLSNLIDARISKDELIEAEIAMYDRKETELRNRLKQLQKADFSSISSSQWRQELSEHFQLMVEMGDIVKNGTFEEKKEALDSIGSNLGITGKKLSISYAEEVNIFIEALKAAKAKNPSFEPKNTLANKDKTDTFVSVCPTLLRR